ncbi:DMT family transporter [Microbacterium indicum]|uniref:DMT family transporter n=1 Tax=Microbacterium indicum TaxID=358100 RepID=UPI0004198F1F|nr:multidrug efflux SMR transporter [Microbacterium indicum]
MDWLILISSGALEAVWATALSASKGFRRWRPALLFVVSMIASMAGLAVAMVTIPTGTAYAVWVGIGAVLTVLLSAIRREERITWARAGLLMLLVGCVVGLKAVS